MHFTQVLRGSTQRVITSKQGNKNFYKGNRSGRMGRHTPKGFIIESHRVRQFIVPDLSTFELTPYVSKEANKAKKVYANDFKTYFRKKNLPKDFDQELRRNCKISAEKAYRATFSSAL